MSAPSIYIFLNKFSIVDVNRENMNNRHYRVNMKAVGVVVMPESAITLLSFTGIPVENHMAQILCGGSAKIFRFWLFCTDLVAN